MRRWRNISSSTTPADRITATAISRTTSTSIRRSTICRASPAPTNGARRMCVVNRMGDSLLNHDFSIPWRETKFEQAAEFGGALKGLFVHIEMIQPRRAGERRRRRPFARSGFHARRNMIAWRSSTRSSAYAPDAGSFRRFMPRLTPIFRNGHDDPLNFKVDSFADSLDRLIEKLLQARSNSRPPMPRRRPMRSLMRRCPQSGGFWIDALWDTSATRPQRRSDRRAAKVRRMRMRSAAMRTAAGAKAPERTNSAAAASSAAAPPSATARPPRSLRRQPPRQASRPAPHAAAKCQACRARERSAPQNRRKNQPKIADAEVCTPHRGEATATQTCEPDSAGARGSTARARHRIMRAARPGTTAPRQAHYQRKIGRRTRPTASSVRASADLRTSRQACANCS